MFETPISFEYEDRPSFLPLQFPPFSLFLTLSYRPQPHLTGVYSSAASFPPATPPPPLFFPLSLCFNFTVSLQPYLSVAAPPSLSRWPP
ncbi:unnamed protein product [Citrullus colocynthis]|uniref:Uncharacterized protein n=1 Tax=Citrullus colocynthis TaxID=252529 RepID=A0ABP0XNJ0_9ROSI